MQVVVQFALVDQLRARGIHRFEFYSHLQVGLCVYALVDFAESALVDFAQDFVVFTHLLHHLRHLNYLINQRKLKLPH